MREPDRSHYLAVETQIFMKSIFSCADRQTGHLVIAIAHK
jgi:hypothetical protein